MKTKLKVAGGRYNRNISRNHFTTMGFGELFPVYAEQALPNDHFTIKPDLFGRSQQSLVPTLTKLSVVQRAFYVPYASVWKHWNEFINGLPLKFSNGSSTGYQSVYCKEVPYITRKNLTALFLTETSDEDNTGLTYTVSLESIQAGTDYFDFFIETTDGYLYYKLTRKGKNLLKVLQSLGYNFNMTANLSSQVDEKYNFLDLACYFKVLFDRYYPSQLRVNSSYDDFFQSLNELRPNSSGLINVPYWLLAKVAYFPPLYYDNNYFTSQWLSPNEPVPNYLGTTTNFISDNVLNQSEHTNEVVATSNDVSANDTTLPTSATRNIMMSSLRKYVMRMGLVGSRAIDRFFATFGVHIPELELSMCKYCGSIDSPIQMMDVTSQGDSASLGDMAGKSWVASSDGTFKIDCDQHGMVFVLASIDVPSQYTSGVRRRVMHLRPHDFYSPDFDDSTLQATSGSELLGQILYNDAIISGALQSLKARPSDIFGFCARYDEYRKPLDDITGDFNIPSLNLTIDGYVNPRRIIDRIALENQIAVSVKEEGEPLYSVENNVYDKNIYNLGLSPLTIMPQSDYEQFNRIYKDLEGVADPLRCHYHFHVSVNGCVKPSDIAQFVDGSGSTIEIEKNGNKFD